MKTFFEQRITYGALHYLRTDEQLSDFVISNSKTKNVCAPLPLIVIASLETTLTLLGGMSKREFITLAIMEALDKAQLIIDDCKTAENWEYLKESHEESLNKDNSDDHSVENI